MKDLPLRISSEPVLSGREPLVGQNSKNLGVSDLSSATALLTVLRDALAAGTHPPDLILRATADTARILTGANGIAIALRTGGVVVCRARSGDLAPQLGALLNVDSGISGECFRSSKVLRCDDARSDDRVDPEVCHLLGIRSIAAVPLSGPEGTFGILEGFSSRANAFTDEQISFLKNLGEIAEGAYYRESAAKAQPPGQARGSLDPGTLQPFLAREEKRSPTIPNEILSKPAKTRRRYLVLSVAAAMVLLVAAVVWWTWREPIRESTSGQPIGPPSAAVEEASGVNLPVRTPLKPSPTLTDEKSVGPRTKGVVQNAAKIESIESPDLTRRLGTGTLTATTKSIDPPVLLGETSQLPPSNPEVEPPTVVLSTPINGDKLTAVASVPVGLPALEVRISQGVTQANIVKRVDPAYPREAMNLRMEGSVTLDASVAEDGTIREVKVVRGPPIFAAAAVAAVRQWRYHPSLLNGKPTAVQREITILFKLP